MSIISLPALKKSLSCLLKKMRKDAEAEQPVFDGLEGELGKASSVSDRMSRVHSERDVELDHYRQLHTSLHDRWQAVFAQIDLRLRELDQLGRQLGYYRESYDWLIKWIADAKQRQEKIQAVPITDSKTLKEQLAQEKVPCVGLAWKLGSFVKSSMSCKAWVKSNGAQYFIHMWMYSCFIQSEGYCI